MKKNSLLDRCHQHKLIGKEYPNLCVNRIKTNNRGTLWHSFVEYSYQTSYTKPRGLGLGHIYLYEDDRHDKDESNPQIQVVELSKHAFASYHGGKYCLCLIV